MWIDRLITCTAQSTYKRSICSDSRFTFDGIQRRFITACAYVLPPGEIVSTADIGFPALDRAKLLDEADFFEKAHTAAAQTGQSAVPTDLDVDTHFIAFIEAPNAKG